MKNKLLSILLLTVLCLSLFACTSQKDTGAEDAEKPESFYTAEAIVDEFMSICEEQDVQGMYDLYYNNMLDQIYERISKNITKQNFDLLLAEEMASIESYELYMYGSEEMPGSVPPLYYVDYINYNTAGADTGLTDQSVTDCAVLRVFMNSGKSTDHMLAKIDGAWYVTN